MRHLLLPCLAFASCHAPDAPASPSRTDALKEVASVYATWGKVDDRLRWSPGLCTLPPAPEPRMSAAPAVSPHGRKLYHLYAKNGEAYTGGGEQPAGQVIVKEAWEPVGADGRFRAGAKQGLYVMMKGAAEDVDSDAGWVYGTLTPDGRVSSFGRVESCMGCHRDAPRDRIFGLRDRVRAPRSIDPHGTRR